MRITGAPFPPTPLYSLSCPLTGPQFSRAARSVHLAELKVLGLERFLDLRLAVPRRVLLRLLLLRGRGRARGQAVQHLPDVEFPHGLGGAPPRPGRGGKRRPRAGGGGRARAEGSFDRGAGESGSARGSRQLGRSKRESKQEILRRRARRGHQSPGRGPLLLRGRRCCRAASAAAAAASLRGPAAQQWRRRPEPAPPSLTWPRADSAPRRRPGSPPLPPPPRPWPAAPPLLARPGPAVPRRFLPLPLLLLLVFSGGRRLSVRGRRSASQPLSAAARPASHAGRPGWVPALSASRVRRRIGPPSLLQSPGCLPQAPAPPALPPGRSLSPDRAPRHTAPTPARSSSGSRGYSAGRGGGGSWGSAERGC